MIRGRDGEIGPGERSEPVKFSDLFHSMEEANFHGECELSAERQEQLGS